MKPASLHFFTSLIALLGQLPGVWRFRERATSAIRIFVGA